MNKVLQKSISMEKGHASTARKVPNLGGPTSQHKYHTIHVFDDKLCFLRLRHVLIDSECIPYAIALLSMVRLLLHILKIPISVFDTDKGHIPWFDIIRRYERF